MAPRVSFPSSTSEITTLLVDLDGTLVDMKRVGLEVRFMLKAAWRFGRAIWPWRFRRAFWYAAQQLQSHGTSKTNYRVFLESLARYSRKSTDQLDRLCQDFLRQDFPAMASCFHPVQGARETLLLAHELGYRIVIATNAAWPRIGVEQRLEWALVSDIPFHYVANSEVMTRCKPDIGYYRELLDLVALDPAECLMIGNDPRKDLPAHDVGIRTFLVDVPKSRKAIEGVLDDSRLDGWGTFLELREWMKRTAEGAST